MAMVYIRCPYCGHPKGPVSVNPKAVSGLIHVSCPKCRKSFSYKHTYEKITTYKE